MSSTSSTKALQGRAFSKSPVSNTHPSRKDIKSGPSSKETVHRDNISRTASTGALQICCKSGKSSSETLKKGSKSITPSTEAFQKGNESRTPSTESLSKSRTLSAETIEEGNESRTSSREALSKYITSSAETHKKVRTSSTEASQKGRESRTLSAESLQKSSKSRTSSADLLQQGSKYRSSSRKVLQRGNKPKTSSTSTSSVEKLQKNAASASSLFGANSRCSSSQSIYQQSNWKISQSLVESLHQSGEEDLNELVGNFLSESNSEVSILGALIERIIQESKTAIDSKIKSKYDGEAQNDAIQSQSELENYSKDHDEDSLLEIPFILRSSVLSDIVNDVIKKTSTELVIEAKKADIPDHKVCDDDDDLTEETAKEIVISVIYKVIFDINTKLAHTIVATRHASGTATVTHSMSETNKMINVHSESTNLEKINTKPRSVKKRISRVFENFVTQLAKKNLMEACAEWIKRNVLGCCCCPLTRTCRSKEADNDISMDKPDSQLEISLKTGDSVCIKRDCFEPIPESTVSSTGSKISFQKNILPGSRWTPSNNTLPSSTSSELYVGNDRFRAKLHTGRRSSSGKERFGNVNLSVLKDNKNSTGSASSGSSEDNRKKSCCSGLSCRSRKQNRKDLKKAPSQHKTDVIDYRQQTRKCQSPTKQSSQHEDDSQ